MDNEREEWFVFLNFAVADVGLARRILASAEEGYPPFVEHCLLREAVVVYARPFKASNGRFKARLKLSDQVVPDECKDLHAQMIAYRDMAFAHTDLRARDPQLHCWTGFDPPKLFIRVAPVDREPLNLKKTKLRKLIDGVFENVSAELESVRCLLHAEVQNGSVSD